MVVDASDHPKRPTITSFKSINYFEETLNIISIQRKHKHNGYRKNQPYVIGRYIFRKLDNFRVQRILMN